MEKICIFKYDNFKRFVFILFYIFSIFIGLFLLLVPNLFANIFGWIVVIVTIAATINILFFKSLEFHDDFLLKQWYIFGEKKIKYDNLKVGASKRVWSGTIFFSDKNKGYFSNFFMTFETFPIGNEGFREIRSLLIDKKIIQGDENEWNY
ncbi:hypothetical protein [Sulfuricurvum sp.]|uniref:hypothetical protein n=1 Tax=Sulfuricurvum sp. TaxID=2025608 RepID=UPI002613E311|nr:hypothetical protein [Sulfuricurvum sp.]MDD4883159.1 hypothetical protein [Sulfuricurvum sp.]